MSKVSKFTESYIIRKIDKETVNIQILDNDALMAIVGEFNNNLLELEKLTNNCHVVLNNKIILFALFMDDLTTYLHLFISMSVALYYCH